ncbi:hypothetical protein BRADI_1g71380v3 [Brachypodium distachyon]|uniref:Uncharacterized protein n=1 Tax=Brachypodium distachyon TaxID=15368 RepID=A0A2K2DUM8_BRADI|nr:hypothetical protein BRADI_1g71380v3 [Brachypodium distachyon]
MSSNCSFGLCFLLCVFWDLGAYKKRVLSARTALVLAKTQGSMATSIGHRSSCGNLILYLGHLLYFFVLC